MHATRPKGSIGTSMKLLDVFNLMRYNDKINASKATDKGLPSGKTNSSRAKIQIQNELFLLTPMGTLGKTFSSGVREGKIQALHRKGKEKAWGD